jgi:hypothetical protein
VILLPTIIRFDTADTEPPNDKEKATRMGKRLSMLQEVIGFDHIPLSGANDRL